MIFGHKGIFRFGLLIFVVSISFAGWTPEIRVTAPDGNDMDHVPEIVIDGSNSAFVFWYGLTSGSVNYYYSRWFSGAFEPETLLSLYPNQIGTPFGTSVDTGGDPWVVWPYVYSSNYGTMVSKWNGNTFVIDTVVDGHAYHDPDIACANDGYNWVTFDYGDDIGFSRWNGVSWSPVGLVNSPDELYDSEASIAISPENYPWSVWMEYIVDANNDTTSEISYTQWNGSGWEPEAYITSPDTNFDYRPQIAFSQDGIPWVVWTKYLKKERDPYGYWIWKWGEVYYSKREGANWSTPQAVNTPDTLQDKFPSIVFGNDSLPWVVWCGKNESGIYNIYIAKYNGTSFDPEEEIVSTTSKDYWPEIAFDSLGNTWVVWVRETDDIYTKIFDETAPVVNLISPNGGELFVPGDTCDINWLASDNIGVDSLSIFYSTDAGNNWLVISSGETNDSVYEWTIPDTPSDSCLVKITAYDAGLNQHEDTSDSFFVIQGGSVAENRTLKPGSSVLEVYPNPSRDRIDMRWKTENVDLCSMFNATHATSNLKIYDATGSLVESFNHLTIQPFNQVTWDCTDDKGRKVSPGVYFIRFEYGDHITVEKAILLR
ncbi:T9SS type A sorting domain-containing protein [candidate division WOR-3 bacterium]|nr:T9SS type A sorting domain-containing protein [candidate division WOR-3 bacterium]